MLGLIKRLSILVLFCLPLLPPATFASKSDRTFYTPILDTPFRLKLNALSENDRKNFTLVISPGEFTTVDCKPPLTLYKLTAILKNNSNDTLKYIDWTTTSSIWRVNNNKFPILPANGRSPCDEDVDHNFIAQHIVLPHQQVEIKLIIFFKGRTKKINTDIRIGMIMQRIFKQSDYWASQGWFFKHELSDQTINLIWSNMITMTNR